MRLRTTDGMVHLENERALVRLRPGATGSPPIMHKGVELVLVANGLVQIDLGSATPVLRAGDSALATKVTVVGWRNLAAERARLFRGARGAWRPSRR